MAMKRKALNSPEKIQDTAKKIRIQENYIK